MAAPRYLLAVVVLFAAFASAAAFTDPSDGTYVCSPPKAPKPLSPPLPSAPGEPLTTAGEMSSVYRPPRETDFTRFPSSTPIVIDNGASTFRIGWAGEAEPRVAFRNIVQRLRYRISGATIIRIILVLWIELIEEDVGIASTK